MIRPRALERGARIALVAAAGPLPDGALDRAVARVTGLGWEPLPGAHSEGRHGYLAGTDAERIEDLSAALESPDNDAIWLLRGGYGTMRILRHLDLSPLLRRPRPLIGFSDNTALHLTAQRLGVVTFHGPHPAAPELPGFALERLRQVVAEDQPAGVLPLPETHPHPQGLVPGTATGRLAGGNLSLLAATVGTQYQVDPRGAILFIEEVGEPLYRIDRLLTQLMLSGALEGAAAIAVGAMSECPDEGGPGLPSPAEIVLDRLGPLGVPISCGLPFGHIPETWTLPLGVRARLDAYAGTLEILDPAVVR
ncbi:MAG: LD-carboxypeptidase [Gemmatimonadota bacterium]